jgi:tetratricopeptide (TPR) repeat protein
MQATLSHYRILEEVGAGGMGVVYRAHDERLDRDVALKVLPPGTVVDSSARRRFRKEALTLSKLNHPNIATVHDFDTAEGTDFLIEEFIEGLSLDTILAAGPLPTIEIINLGLQLCEGLAAAHDHGIIHRDLKPANVCVTSEARLKILDFGLAEILRGEVGSDALTISTCETQAIVGTLPYMAPEQLLARKYDVRTDIWAAGCVLFEMATGRRPFLGSGAALTDAILHQPAGHAAKLNPRVSTELDAAIQRCLEKDPRRRYSSAREIAVDLRRASEPRRTRTGFKARTWVIVLLMALLASAVAAKPWLRRFSQLNWFTTGVASEARQPAPHESYLAGMKYLERWDKIRNLDLAADLFQQSVQADPNFALGFRALAEVDWARYRLNHDSHWVEEAERNCRRAVELNPRLPAVYVTLARILNGTGQYNLALEEIQKALDLGPLDAEAQLTEAGVFASLGQQDAAENLFKTAAALRPENWDGYYELGAFYYRSGRNAEATVPFERALQITPDNSLVHATLGGVLQVLQKYAEAEQHLKRSIELQPSYTAYTNLGAFYLRRRRWAEAASTTRKALAMNGSDWSAWANLGIACEWLNRTTDAADAYRNEESRLEGILKVRGDDPELQAELGMLYSKRGLQERALPMTEAALTRAPDDPNILSTAAETHENLGNRALALQLAQKSLSRGWTLEQLQGVPSLRKLILDSRFREIAQQFTNNANPAQQ